MSFPFLFFALQLLVASWIPPMASPLQYGAVALSAPQQSRHEQKLLVLPEGLRMPEFFGDNMVLQSNYECGVRSFLNGWAKPYDTVSIDSGDGRSYLTQADYNGEWSLQLDPPGLHANIGAVSRTISVSTNRSTDAPIVARNVYYGDVWLCAGGAAITETSWNQSSIPWSHLTSNLRIYVMEGDNNSNGTSNTSSDSSDSSSSSSGSSSGTGSSGNTPLPQHRWLSSDTKAHAAALAATSQLCLLAAADFLQKMSVPVTRKIGIIVASTPAIDEDIRSWIPPNASAAQSCGSHSTNLVNVRSSYRENNRRSEFDSGDTKKDSDSNARAILTRKRSGKTSISTFGTTTATSSTAVPWGSRYNSLIAPLSLVSFRTVVFALSPAELPNPGGTALYSCLLRALITTWRDGMQVGDYAFSVIQNSAKAPKMAVHRGAMLPKKASGNIHSLVSPVSSALALAEYSILPHCATVLGHGTSVLAHRRRHSLKNDNASNALLHSSRRPRKSIEHASVISPSSPQQTHASDELPPPSPNPFRDTLNVDTTGLVPTFDLLRRDLESSLTGKHQWLTTAARRVAATVLHVAFAKQPLGSYAGPRPSNASWMTISGSTAATFRVRFDPTSLGPDGGLILRPTEGCSACCSGALALDVQLCPGVEPDDLTKCLRVNTTVDSSQGEQSLIGTVLTDDDKSQRRRDTAMANPLLPLHYNTIVLMASRSPANQECLLGSTASTIPTGPSALLIHNSTRRWIDDGQKESFTLHHANVSTLKSRPSIGMWRQERNQSNLFGTPPMGWNHWNAYHCDVSERLIIETADMLVATGLAAAGYTMTGLDDCWMVDRQADGTIGVDPVRFPSGMQALADYIHARGLKFGIYQAPAATTPQGRPGLLNHEAQDVATFCDWGVDYLKLDSRGSTREGWEKVRAAIDACTARRGSPMFLQVAFCTSVAGCQGWMETLANSWRTSADAQATWDSVMLNVDKTEPLWPLAGPTGPIGGHWNDADLLEVGNVGLSFTEMKTQISLWSFMNVPILLSCNLKKLAVDKDMLALLTHRGILALNQDALGYQGRRIVGGPSPSPSPGPTSTIRVAACNASDAAQHWRVDASVLSGSNLNANHSIGRYHDILHADEIRVGGRIVHNASGLILTSTSCAGVHELHKSVPLALKPNATNCSGDGANQLWLAQPNGTVTLALDGSCLDVYEHRNPVQSYFCVPGNTVPISQVWRFESVPESTMASAYDNNNLLSPSPSLKMIYFEGEAPHYTRCLQAEGALNGPPDRHVEKTDSEAKIETAAPLLTLGTEAAPYRPGRDLSKPAQPEVWEKQLASGNVALLLLNRGDAPAMLNIAANLSDVPGIMSANTTVNVTDVWSQRNLGLFRGQIVRSICSHCATVLLLEIV